MADRAQRAISVAPMRPPALQGTSAPTLTSIPGAKSFDEAIFCDPRGAAIRHRLAHQLYLVGAQMLARIIAEIAPAETDRHSSGRRERLRLLHRPRRGRRDWLTQHSVRKQHPASRAPYRCAMKNRRG